MAGRSTVGPFAPCREFNVTLIASVAAAMRYCDPAYFEAAKR